MHTAVARAGRAVAAPRCGAASGDVGGRDQGRSTAYEPCGMPTKVVRSMAAA